MNASNPPSTTSNLPDFLPGRLFVDRGAALDYARLGGFHYCARRPATWAAIRVVRYDESRGEKFAHSDDPIKFSRAVAVAVLSYPVPSCGPREKHLARDHFSRKENLIFANASIRTISRVIVHPQFRALGLARVLIESLFAACDTRYVEALAAMGRIHPMFERAGMTRIDPSEEGKPIYFIFDRCVAGSPR